MSTPNITVGHAAVYPSPVMIPTAPECGSPCAEFEALAHDNARLREELAALRAALDPERIIAAIDLPGGHFCDPQAVADAIRAYCRAALAGKERT